MGDTVLVDLENDDLNMSENGGRSSSECSVPFQPYIRFRRAARAIRMLVNVCLTCKAIMQAQVMRETWYALADSILDGGCDPSENKRKFRPFITFVPNEGQLEQLSFDPNDFCRDSAAEQMMTEDIQESLRLDGPKRSPEQRNLMLKFMKRFSPDFCRFPKDVQKQLCSSLYYAKYQKNRVILKKGLLADGMHFLLSGEAVLKTEGRKQPRQIKVGELFGVEELMCGSTRKITVITKSSTELISLHRLDYQRIFQLAEDAENPKHLNICKNDIVFKHFPMQKLVDNPGVWTVLAYKFGRLMVRDSNETEWIFIIKSGEARVIKTLPSGRYDVIARRQKVKKTLDASCPYHKARQMLTFTSNNKIESCYKREVYTPSRLRKVLSAPPGCLYNRRGSFDSIPDPSYRAASCMSDRTTKSARLRKILNTPSRPTTVYTDVSPVRNTFMELPGDNDETFENPNDIDREMSRTLKVVKGDSGDDTETSGDISLPDIANKSERPRQVQLEDKPMYVKTGLSSARSSRREATIDTRIEIPPFVQIETLHAGHSFGFRACLPEEERGPSASLVSGGCEVLLVNKKFFMMHCDEAVSSLIRLKYKAYPSDEELIDRLDANLQWNEYKQKTMTAEIRKLQEKKKQLAAR